MDARHVLGKAVRALGARKSGGRLFSAFRARRIIGHFGGGAGHNLDETKGTLGYGLVHYALIFNTKPNNVLCIGSARGFIPAICATACKDNQAGHVDFVDAGYSKSHPDNWGGDGFWKTKQGRKQFNKFGLKDWITLHVATSEEFAKSTQKKWQYIYIDADHSYRGVKKDYRLYWPRLEPGGFMVFHDVLLRHHTDPAYDRFGVWKFWEELKSDCKIIVPFTHSFVLPSGLGILQKSTTG